LVQRIALMETNIKPEINIADPAFSAGQSNGHLLAIELSWDRMTFAVYDNDRSKFVALESFATGKLQLPGQLLEKIGQITAASTILKTQYRQVRIMWGGKVYTLIPDALFDEKESSSYLWFTQSLQPGDIVFTDRLKNLGAANVFAVPAILKETLNQMFPGHRFSHFLTVLAESLLIQNKNSSNEIGAFINVGAQFFDLIVIKEGKLLFCNTFEYRNAEDFLYYLLFSFEQLKINPEETGVVLIGEIVKPSAIHDRLMKYIRDVAFIPVNKAWQYSYVFDEVPAHANYNLLNILTCE
jgi:hypothetical protein